MVWTGDKASYLSKSNLTALLSVLLHNKSEPTECVPPKNAARAAEWGIVRTRPPDCIHRRPPRQRGGRSWWGIAMARIPLNWACETQENLQGMQAGAQDSPNFIRVSNGLVGFSVGWEADSVFLFFFNLRGMKKKKKKVCASVYTEVHFKVHLVLWKKGNYSGLHLPPFLSDQTQTSSALMKSSANMSEEGRNFTTL